MGLSASQARLLTITAKLTSNEYESQQISNAKMRLATQSEEASTEYINALNSKKLMFTTYDAQGDAVTQALTANALYEYSDLKNQYALVNSSGQILISSSDAKKFEEADNLEEFLESYGITKEYISTTIEENVAILQSDKYQGYYEAWEDAINAAKYATYSGEYVDADGVTQTYENVSSSEAYQIEKTTTYNAYLEALETYEDTLTKDAAGIDTDITLEEALTALQEAKAAYSSTVTYDTWLQSKAAYGYVDDDGEYVAAGEEQDVYKNVRSYYAVLAELTAEAENLGCDTLEDIYTYSDEEMAQWYTNLWYRLNGDSSDKSAQGLKKTNYEVLDSTLASSTTWLQDALTQGLITIEKASYTESTNIITDSDNPLSVQLTGITWTSMVYTSCTDFTEEDDDTAIAQAEAEYERKTNEINAKDEKYENQIKTLDTEHNSLQTEYESVQSAMSKNIERSFNAFS